MKLNDFTIEKKEVQCYKISHSSGMYWATITLDIIGPGRGRIQISSDFGNWANGWGAAGDDFKKFLTGLDIHYAAGKFGADRWFDHEATIREFRSFIDRNGDHFENVDRLLDQINQLEHSIHKEEFIVNLTEKQDLMRAFDHMPEIVHSIDPRFRNFWEGPWQVFINTLKQEASNENP